MGVEEYALLRALMANNEEMRVIAVGDDDQNIYEFRGSDSDYMYRLTQEHAINQSICISHSLKNYFNIKTKALRVYSPKQTKRLLS